MLYVRNKSGRCEGSDDSNRLATQIRPPRKAARRQPRRLIMTLDKGPSKNISAMPTEPTHAAEGKSLFYEVYDNNIIKTLEEIKNYEGAILTFNQVEVSVHLIGDISFG